MENRKLINYWGVLLTCFFNDMEKCSNGAREHMLVSVLSGELELDENGTITTVRRGECVFIRKDVHLIMTKRPCEGEQFSAIYLVFLRDFLRRFYHTLDRKDMPAHLKRGELSVHRMPDHPDFKSLYLSITPYFDTTVQPSEEWANLKLHEGLIAVLKTDKRFYPCLFDFTEEWKIDILDFMNENYMYDLSTKELASYTGRSLTSFKRDFAKISELPPGKWIVNKRLEVARVKLEDKDAKISDVCFEVGFKNLSHFSRIYKEAFGSSPSGN